MEKASRIVLKVLSSEARASFLFNFGDDLASCGVNLGLCQGFFTRLQGNESGNRFLPFGYPRAFIIIEDADMSDERVFSRRSGLYDIGRFHALIGQESEVTLRGHKFRKYELQFGPCGPQFRRRYVIEKQLKTSDRLLCSHGFEGAWMELPKRAYDIFWPQLDRGRPEGMEPWRSAGNELQTGGRHAERRKKCGSVRFGIEPRRAASTMPCQSRS